MPPKIDVKPKQPFISHTIFNDVTISTTSPNIASNNRRLPKLNSSIGQALDTSMESLDHINSNLMRGSVDESSNNIRNNGNLISQMSPVANIIP